MNAYVFPGAYSVAFDAIGGGLVVIARDPDHVVDLVTAYREEGAEIDCSPIELWPRDWADVVTYPIAGDADPRVFVFPDASCY